jgi:hypothetical protein
MLRAADNAFGMVAKGLASVPGFVSLPFVETYNFVCGKASCDHIKARAIIIVFIIFIYGNLQSSHPIYWDVKIISVPLSVSEDALIRICPAVLSVCTSTIQ